MYILTDLAKVTQDEKLRAAARAQPRGQVYAARRRGTGAARPAVLGVLRRRRTAHA
jgi:hypothetical protein